MNLTITCDVSNQPNREENERSLLQDGKQEDDMKVMTTNRRPLVMMWSKTAPKGTKRAKVAPTTMM